jgi:hypothetical protein
MDELRTMVLKKSKSGSHFPMKETGKDNQLLVLLFIIVYIL